MASKNGKLVRIEEMKVMLRTGADRADILKELIKTYKVSVPTLDNELKEAREAIRAEMEAKEALLQAEMSEQLKSEINACIKSDLELDLILSQIATNNLEIEEYVRGEAVLRGVTPFEQIAAIDKLYKRRGSYAPVKQAATNAAGEDVKHDLSKLSDKELAQLAQIKAKLCG